MDLFIGYLTLVLVVGMLFFQGLFVEKFSNNGIIYGENGKLFEKFDLLNEERLINNIDCSDRNKFMFICNKYMDSEVNYLIKNPATNNLTISEYISNFNFVNNDLSVEFLANDKQFKKLAYMII